MTPLQRAHLDARWSSHFDRIRVAEVADVPCGTCTLCCSGDSTNVGLLPEEYGKFESVEILGEVLVKRLDNGDCVYLGESGCTIHDDKPLVCQKFDCRDDAAHLHERVRARGRVLREA